MTSSLSLGAPIRHLLVDLDGTLLGNRNLPLSFDFVRRALANLQKYGGWSKSVRALLAIRGEFDRPSPELTNDIRVVALFSRIMNLPQDVARKVLRDGVARVFPTLEKHFYPVPGAKEFLDWARNRYTLTLATNPVWPTDIIELRVRWAGIDPSIFSHITDVRLMHACKPAPEYYREILAQQGMKPEDCLLIGDNVKMDLPATQVGIRVFIVGQNYKSISPLNFPGAQAPAWKGTYPMLRQALESLPANPKAEDLAIGTRVD